MLITVFSFVEFGSLTTSQLMEKVRGLQNLAFQLGLDEAKFLTWSTFLRVKSDQGLISLYNISELSSGHQLTRGYCKVVIYRTDQILLGNFY